jgi:hypothetical protein
MKRKLRNLIYILSDKRTRWDLYRHIKKPAFVVSVKGKTK